MMILHWISLLLCFACSSDKNSDDVEPLMLTSIQISGTPVRLDLNEEVVLSVLGFDQNGDEIAIDSEISWGVSNSNASVDASGRVKGLAVGEVVLTATVESLSKTASLRIWDSSAPRVEVYVTDAANFNNGGSYKVIRYDDEGKYAETLIDKNLAWPQDIVFLEDEEAMLVSNLSSNKIEKFDISSGEHIETFATVANGPTRMKIGADGLLYVLQWNNSAPVVRYRTDGTFVDEFTSVGINQAIGMDWDSEGNFYVSSYQGFVQKFGNEGGDLGRVITSGLQGPTNIWITSADAMFVLEWTGGTVKSYELDGTLKSTTASGLVQAEGIDQLPDGRFLIGNGGTGVLKVLSGDGAFEKDYFAARFGGLQTPNGVVIRLVNQ